MHSAALSLSLSLSLAPSFPLRHKYRGGFDAQRSNPSLSLPVCLPPSPSDTNTQGVLMHSAAIPLSLPLCPPLSQTQTHRAF